MILYHLLYLGSLLYVINIGNFLFIIPGYFISVILCDSPLFFFIDSSSLSLIIDSGSMFPTLSDSLIFFILISKLFSSTIDGTFLSIGL